MNVGSRPPIACLSKSIPSSSKSSFLFVGSQFGANGTFSIVPERSDAFMTQTRSYDVLHLFICRMMGLIGTDPALTGCHRRHSKLGGIKRCS